MTTPINISDEAKCAAADELSSETERSYKPYKNPPSRGHYIQLLLNSRDDELQALRRDKKRLEWVLQSGATVLYAVDVWEVYLPGRGLPFASGNTAREAIDAAMSGKEGK